MTPMVLIRRVRDKQAFWREIKGIAYDAGAFVQEIGEACVTGSRPVAGSLIGMGLFFLIVGCVVAFVAGWQS